MYDPFWGLVHRPAQVNPFLSPWPFFDPAESEEKRGSPDLTPVGDAIRRTPCRRGCDPRDLTPVGDAIRGTSCRWGCDPRDLMPSGMRSAGPHAVGDAIRRPPCRRRCDPRDPMPSGCDSPDPASAGMRFAGFGAGGARLRTMLRILISVDRSSGNALRLSPLVTCVRRMVRQGCVNYVRV